MALTAKCDFRVSVSEGAMNSDTNLDKVTAIPAGSQSRLQDTESIVYFSFSGNLRTCLFSGQVMFCSNLADLS